MVTTRFKVGQLVRSTVQEQGMKIGQIFTVAEVAVTQTFIGAIVTYILKADGPDSFVPVGNGHLLLEAVDCDRCAADEEVTPATCQHGGLSLCQEHRDDLVEMESEQASDRDDFERADGSFDARAYDEAHRRNMGGPY